MNEDARRRLHALLDQEIEVAASLSEILAAEKTALTGDSPLAVEEHAAQKVRLFEIMEELDTQRRTLWKGTDQASPVAETAVRWRSLLQLLARCRDANELNGHIINVRRHQVRQLLDIVRGAPAPFTYGPQGKTTSTALRALARA